MNTLWKDRILSALIAVVATAALTLVVVRLSPKGFTAGQIREGITYEVTGVASDTIVAEVDGNGAEAELLTYWMGSYCSYLNTYSQYYTGEDVDLDAELMDGLSARDYIKDESLEILKQQLVLENLAARYGAALSAGDEAGLAETRAENIAQLGGEDNYRAELYKLGISKEGYDRLQRSDYLYGALYELYSTPGSALYASDDVLHAYAAGEGYITADHILLLTRDMTTGQALDEDAAAQKRALAEELLRRLRDSSDPVTLFQELADEYSEDSGRAAYPDGYTFTYGTMVGAFDEAARGLEENAYSDIVESTYGYHIILRKPLNVAEAVEEVREEYFDAFLTGEIERAEMTVNPVADDFDVAAIYEALKAAQGAPDASSGTSGGRSGTP